MLPLPRRDGLVGRADLLRILAKLGADGLELAVPFLGYVRLQPTPVEPEAGLLILLEPGPGPSLRQARQPTVVGKDLSRFRPNYFGVVFREETDAPKLPDRLALAEEPKSDRMPNWSPPAFEPLVFWSHLGPFLKSSLGTRLPSREPDVGEIMRHLGDGRTLRQIPRIERQRWAPRILVVKDRSRHLWAYQDDYNAVDERLKSIRGAHTVERMPVRDGPQPESSGGQFDLAIAARRLPHRSAVLILSDLGVLHPESDSVMNAWADCAHALRQSGVSVHVLSPVRAARMPDKLAGVFDIHEWDRGAKLSRRVRGADAQSDGAVDPLEELLTRIAPTSFVDAGLLRSLRLHVGAHAEAEAMIVRGERGAPTGNAGVYFDGTDILVKENSTRERLLNAFCRLNTKEKRAVADLVRRHHGRHYTWLITELRLIDWCLGLAEPRTEQELQEAATHQAYLNGLVRREIHAPGSFTRQHFFPAMLRQQPADLVGENLAYGDIEIFNSQVEPGNDQTIALPERVLTGDFRYLLDIHQQASRAYRLVQRGLNLQLEPDTTALVTGATLARCDIGANRIIATVRRHAQASVTLHRADAPLRLAVCDAELESVEIDLGSQRLRVEPVDRRMRGLPIRRHSTGLWLEVPWLGKIHRIPWRDATPGNPGYWDTPVPIGIDHFGLFAEFSVRGVTQRCRWIEPGTFLMGSPEDELGRGSDETQHTVRLSKGYWLAESACTQALWQAVMGSNPSSFKASPRNPVENVSWEDVVNGFLPKLNLLLPGLEAGLPSEAQWEYACRAGTAEPFSYGTNITPEQVNYDGNYPYGEGAKGVGRSQPVPVASLPCNPWGLYEMHGNVWEWCSDRYGEYASGLQTDPEGAVSGADRVLRGGSWIGDAGYCRSASRDHGDPGYRYQFIGFRLAPGRASQVGTTGPAEPAGKSERQAPGRGTRPGLGGTFERMVDAVRGSGAKPKRKK